MQGTITKAISSFYYVSCHKEIIECKARGNFRKSEISPLVGDKVEFEKTSNGKGIIESVLERKNCLKRPLIANIDKLFIVSSYKTPSPDTLMIDRLCAIAIYNDIIPVVVFNKSDMGCFDEFADIYQKSNIKTYTVSAKTGEGIDALKKETEGCVSAFAGNSGVGKSSLMNALFGELSLKTGEVSEKLGRGRHTTRHTELFSVENTYVADTPGFAAIETDNTIDFRDNLASFFPEFSDCLGNCRFTSCTHTCEPGCELIDALNCGKIQKSRYESYKILFNELKDIKDWGNRAKK